MHVIPVLDLKGGVVVRGVAGRRDEYRPVVSRIARSAEPIEVARAFRTHLALTTLYIADLDAILHDQPHFDLYRLLADDGFHLLVDAGLRTADQARRLLDAGARQVIVGLETWPGPESLREMCCVLEPANVIFSLDLKAGRPLGETAGWGTADPSEIAERAIASGVSELIVLDLAQVGTGQGVPTLDLCGRLRKAYPDVRLITGGGVRDADDLVVLDSLGVTGVLVASALHDGRIKRADLERFRQPTQHVDFGFRISDFGFRI